MTDSPDTWKTFPELMGKIIKGEISPPNLEPMTNDEAVLYIATYGMAHERGSFRNPADGTKSWAVFFLGSGRHGGYVGRNDGSGFVLYYDRGSAENNWQACVKAARFAICQHKKTEKGHRPNHSRGWHPGHCELCGLDMSVDSGD